MKRMDATEVESVSVIQTLRSMANEADQILAELQPLWGESSSLLMLSFTEALTGPPQKNSHQHSAANVSEVAIEVMLLES